MNTICIVTTLFFTITILYALIKYLKLLKKLKNSEWVSDLYEKLYYGAIKQQSEPQKQNEELSKIAPSGLYIMKEQNKKEIKNACIKDDWID